MVDPCQGHIYSLLTVNQHLLSSLATKHSISVEITSLDEVSDDFYPDDVIDFEETVGHLAFGSSCCNTKTIIWADYQSVSMEKNRKVEGVSICLNPHKQKLVQPGYTTSV